MKVVQIREDDFTLGKSKSGQVDTLERRNGKALHNSGGTAYLLINILIDSTSFNNHQDNSSKAYLACEFSRADLEIFSCSKSKHFLLKLQPNAVYSNEEAVIHYFIYFLPYFSYV